MARGLGGTRLLQRPKRSAYEQIGAPHGGKLLPCYGGWINAMAESFISTLEAEMASRRRFPSGEAARAAIFKYIQGFYNSRRRHSALGQPGRVRGG